jgi:hypothetical protein
MKKKSRRTPSADTDIGDTLTSHAMRISGVQARDAVRTSVASAACAEASCGKAISRSRGSDAARSCGAFFVKVKEGTGTDRDIFRPMADKRECREFEAGDGVVTLLPDEWGDPQFQVR